MERTQSLRYNSVGKKKTEQQSELVSVYYRFYHYFLEKILFSYRVKNAGKGEFCSAWSKRGKTHGDGVFPERYAK